ncbi:uncharacterized protein DEA37_0014730 [Paragonimus westermani]|uniref:Uncharacterized protein n=1 Tax=Paragonimus westermani TaxID=34504 RepID=A0A5J4NHR5_9TREM|nr:uncharacterized protein DEA37_0014730 [Paragonimus westermani]
MRCFISQRPCFLSLTILAAINIISGRFWATTFKYTVSYFSKATLQFCIIKPLTSVITIVLQAVGVYKHGVFSVTNGYLYVTVIYNASAFMALYALVLFFLATRDILQPFDPVIKFAAVKSVVFLCFWQGGRYYAYKQCQFLISGVILAVLEKCGVIPALPNTDAGTVAAGIQNFLICMEMLAASIVFRFAFPSQLYSDGLASNGPEYDSLGRGLFSDGGVGDKGKLLSSSSGSLRSLRDTVNPKDMFHDAIHNFHPSYQKYTQQRNPKDDLDEEETTQRNNHESDSIHQRQQPSSTQGNLHKSENHLAPSAIPAPPMPPVPRQIYP